MAEITQKSCVTSFPLWSVKKIVVGYTDAKQQETYEKLKNRVWYSNTNISLMLLPLLILMIDDDDTAASTVAATATTNKSINNSSNCNKNNNNVIITKIIITIKMKNGYALKKS